jgi:predicted hotdog family 3-hydroxylacyl-ACP dehydratase
MKLPDIRTLLPHSGPMVLLDHVVAADANSLSAEVRVRADSLFCIDGGVGGWVGLEYMAQAIGAYAGYRARLHGEPIRIGYLLGTRHYVCKQPRFAVGRVLKIHVKRVWQSDNDLASFDCRIDDESGELASANVTVFQSGDSGKILDVAHAACSVEPLSGVSKEV